MRMAMRFILRALLLLYPRAFRRAFGSDVLASASRAVSERPTRRGRMRQAMHEIGAAMRDLVPAHLDGRRTTGHGRTRVVGIGPDLRLASRHVAGARTVSLIAIGTVAVAIGAATAIFSVADAVLFRPLPYHDSERLVTLHEETKTASRSGISLPAFEIWKRDVRSLASLAWYEPSTSMVMVGDEADRLNGAAVSPEFFGVLAMQPAVGRLFSAGIADAAVREVVISHTLYQRLGGSTAVLGRALLIDPGTYVIVGVMPPGPVYPAGADFWKTTGDYGMLRGERSLRFLSAIGRLAPGADLRTLRAELDVLTERHPAVDRVGGPVRMTADGLKASMVRQVRLGILTALGAVVSLVLIACCNLAALLLAQASARGREHAVQAALGASRIRLLRQQAFEAALVVLPGGALGIWLAWLCRDAIVRLSLNEIPLIGDARLDARVLGCALAATAIAALLAALAPAWLAARLHSTAALRAARGGGHARPVLRVLRGLVVAQIALTFVLTVVGVLLGQTLLRLGRVELGFRAAGVVSLRINLPIGSRSVEAQRTFYDDVLRRVRALPAVQDAALASRLPLSVALASTEVSAAADKARDVRAALQMSSAGLFSTIGARLVSGRGFSDEDSPARPALVLNDILARQLFGTTNPVGERVRFNMLGRPADGTVIGVVGTVRQNGLRAAPLPELYVDYRVRPMIMVLLARTTLPLSDAAPLLTSAVRDADASRRITVDQVTTLEREVSRHLARPRFLVTLVSTFGVVALLLAAAGVYGVMAFVVEAERPALGVKLALGASRRRVLRDVMAQGASLAALGLALGGVGAYGLSGSLGTLLYDISPREPVTYTLAAVFVLGAGLVACWIPARRAGLTDPLSVIRTE
jgi:putative ABC transport system permease protein